MGVKIEKDEEINNKAGNTCFGYLINELKNCVVTVYFTEQIFRVYMNELILINMM